MWGGLPPPVALLFCAATGGFDANATVTSETRVGEAPLQAGGGTQAGVIAVLTPTVDGQYLGHALELRLDYSPRIFWRQPNELKNNRPLVLHLANLSIAGRPARPVRLTAGGNLTAGAADYTSLSFLFGTAAQQQGQRPSDKVTDFLSVSVGAAAEVSVSRTWAVGLDARVTHRRPLGSVETPPPPMPGTPATMQQPVLLRQTTTAVTPSVLDRVSRLTEASLTAPASYTTYDDGTAVYTASPAVGVRTRLGRQWDVRASAGIGVSHVAPGSAALGDTRTEWGPIGGVESSVAVLSKHDAALRFTLALFAEEYVDPILQIAGPRGNALARISALLSPEWTCAIEGTFSTSLARHPATIPNSTLPPDETSASASLPVRYRASDELLVEFGGRWFDRGPHLAAANADFHQRQLWFYVMLTASSRRMPRWTP